MKVKICGRFCRHWWYCITKNSDGYRKVCGLCTRAPRSLIAIGSFTKNLLIKDLLSQGQEQRPQNFHWNFWWYSNDIYLGLGWAWTWLDPRPDLRVFLGNWDLTSAFLKGLRPDPCPKKRYLNIRPGVFHKMVVHNIKLEKNEKFWTELMLWLMVHY